MDYDPQAVNRWMAQHKGKKSLTGDLYEKEVKKDEASPPAKEHTTEPLQEPKKPEVKPDTATLRTELPATSTRVDFSDMEGIIDTESDETLETDGEETRERLSTTGAYGEIAYTIHDPGMNALLEIQIKQGAHFKAESGAMVTMSDTIKLKGRIDGGIGKAILRKTFSKEKFFFQYFTTPDGPGTVMVAPNSIGDIAVIEMSGNESYTVKKDGFLAATSGIDVGTKVQGITKGMFSGEGFFVIKAEGTGLLFVNAFGNIHKIVIPTNKSVTIDNKHLVAWPSHMKWEIVTSSGILSTFTSGEILVCKFRGPGHVYIQSRNPEAFSSWVANEGAFITKKEAAKKK